MYQLFKTKNINKNHVEDAAETAYEKALVKLNRYTCIIESES